MQEKIAFVGIEVVATGVLGVSEESLVDINQTEVNSLDDAQDIYNQVLSNRVVMNFSQEQVPIERVLQSLESLISNGAFVADAILFDGFKLTIASEDDILKIKEFAKKMNIEVWFAVSPVRPDVVFDEYGVPNTLEKYYPLIDVLVALKYDDKLDKVNMTVVRAHSENIPKPAKVALDPKTMLIANCLDYRLKIKRHGFHVAF